MEFGKRNSHKKGTQTSFRYLISSLDENSGQQPQNLVYIIQTNTVAISKKYIGNILEIPMTKCAIHKWQTRKAHKPASDIPFPP